ncbi:hypothetical protein BYT27DRAFT_7219532 [Phlegmacium glaucopus]|nr:hypothetical protein BYT27DRAFT_7219532 [Phlegmacium glaucopus]
MKCLHFAEQRWPFFTHTSQKEHSTTLQLDTINRNAFLELVQQLPYRDPIFSAQLYVPTPTPHKTTTPAPLEMAFSSFDGSRDQQTIINVLSTAALELIPHVLIIIASRPEPPIRKAFNKQPISILSVALDNDYSSQKDIESYFGFRFSELRKDPATALPDAWPSADVIRRLVEKASGQFIFASTVMNYLESSQRHPIESLEIVLGLLRSGDDIPFAELDALYIHIFSSIPTSILPKVLDIFRFLLLSEDSEQKNTKILDPLFEFKPGEAAYALSNLHAILSVYPRLDRSFEIKLLHKSLEDFLLDKSRSGQFYIDPSLGHSMLATRWICRYQKDNNLRILGNSAREAINHYIRGELTQDLIRGLQTFNISQHFSNVLKLEKIEAENYWTSRDEFRLNKRAFTNFYKYIKGQTTIQSCPESSEQQQIYRHFLSQFDDWILSIIERCSDEVQECYGVFIKLNVMADRVCSAEPLGLNNLDEKILFPMLDEFFSDETRSKKHFVDEFKYASIASKWACHKFVPKLPNDFKQIYQHVDYRLRFLVDLTNCLPLSAANVGLAILLLEKTLRFSREATFPKERWRLGVASLDYIKVQGRAYDRKVQWHDEDVLVFFSPPPSP